MSHDAVAIITGASRGLGAATAVELARRGADMVLVARDHTGLDGTAAAVSATGRRAHVHVEDLSTAGAGDRIITAALERFGRVDALINNAAMIEPIKRLARLSDDALHHALAVNVRAPAALIRAALPALRAVRGRVLNLSSSAARTPIEGLGAYCVSKAGLEMLTRVAYLEEPEVTFLSVEPGPVDTDIHVALRTPSQELSGERQRFYQDLRDDGQLEAPDVPAQRLAWLALEAPRSWSGRHLSQSGPDVLEAMNRTQGGPHD